MNCVVCNSQNPEGAKYCGTCGTRLDLNSGPLKEVLEASVRREVDSALQRYLKDQKITEFDITEKVANRLMSWIKIVAAVVGFLSVGAGVLGFNFFNQAKHFFKQAKQGIEKQSEELHEKYGRLKSELAKYEETKKSVSDQQEKINSVLAGLQQQVVSHLRKAAEAGNTDSMYGLGDLYKNGWCVAQDYDEAREWYRKAADAGNPWGMYDLGELYKNGVAKDYEKAREWLQKAAAAGNTEARRELAPLPSK